MLELPAAGLALLGRALIQAADSAMLAIGEEDLRRGESKAHAQLTLRWVRSMKSHPEPTAAAMRAASSGLLAFAAVACALGLLPFFSNESVLGPATRVPLSLLSALVAGAAALVLDLIPRSFAAKNPLTWALALAPLAYPICFILRLPVTLLLRVADAILLRSGVRARYTPPAPPLEQIEKILTEEARAGSSAPPPEMIHGLFAFASRTAKEVMVPRTRVAGVPIAATPSEVLDLLAEEGHTRMPVYKGDLDHVVGVLHTKDVVPLLAHPQLIVLQDLLRAPLFVPWNMPVGTLLKEMQQRRSHLALVVDEFGGFAGVVSIEDIIEQIVGDLPDEHTLPERSLQLGADGSGLFPAETRVDELNRALEAALPDGDFETLAGLLNSCAGAIPQQGDQFFVGGLELTVAQRDARRVKQVRVRRALSQPPPIKQGGAVN